MKNYYEILDVDRHASQEVIEKAYRALAKKYHPALQQGAKQQEYAEKMKIINQAYDVLSDDIKRQQYDQQLESEEISKEQHERIMRENYELKQQINRMGNQQTNQQSYQQPTQQVDDGTILNMSRVLNEQINAARRQAYHDAYVQDLKNRGYKIRYKRDLKYYIKLIKVLAITILACFLIYQIPFVKNFFIDLYNENVIFQSIVNIFRNTFSSTF